MTGNTFLLTVKAHWEMAVLTALQGKKARDKPLPNKRVDQSGHFCGLVIEIRPKITKVLIVYQKTQKNLIFSTFLRISQKVLVILI